MRFILTILMSLVYYCLCGSTLQRDTLLCGSTMVILKLPQQAVTNSNFESYEEGYFKEYQISKNSFITIHYGNASVVLPFLKDLKPIYSCQLGNIAQSKAYNYQTLFCRIDEYFQFSISIYLFSAKEDVDICTSALNSIEFIIGNNAHRTEHRIPAVPIAVAAGGVASDAVLTSVTDYCGPMVYEDGRLDRIQLEGGYLSYTGSSGQRLDRPEYHFYIRDHLGNNRMDLDGDGGVWQAVHYYPFGLTMGEGYRTGSQRWTFGGKEMDRVAGLDLLDFEARAYCPATARFLRPDPLASNYHPLSPYAYCANNPLTNTDPGEDDYCMQ